MQRKHQLFTPNIIKYNQNISNVPKIFYPQERDWTCSIACIRTILSGIMNNVPTEDDIVNINNMQPGPYYSKDIKNLGFLENYDVIYGCDNKNINMDDILILAQNGYYIMLKCMYNYAHWLVFLGYYSLENNNIEKSKFVMYDPYYNEIRIFCVDEFISMWIDGDFYHTKIQKDFIAIKTKK